MEDLYFKSESAKTMFLLLETDGAPRMKFLGISTMHYHSAEAATKWYNYNLSILNQEPTHVSYYKAVEELKEMYKEMIK
jgi:hypothetical protein